MHQYGIGVIAGIAIVASAAAAEQDTGKLVQLLEASLACQNSASAGSSGYAPANRSTLRYTGDTSVFRASVRKQPATRTENADDSYEIAFNFADVGTVRTDNNSVAFTCKRQSAPSCIVTPPNVSSGAFQYSFQTCDARSAENARYASEALMRLNEGLPARPLPAVWAAPTKVDLYWLHNGSSLDLASQGASRKFLYRSPSPLMIDNGVSRGSVLFDGRRSGNEYSGTAYVFNKTCGPLGYPVAGVVSGDDRQVTLQGKAPRRGRNCQVVEYRDEELTFTLQEE